MGLHFDPVGLGHEWEHCDSIRGRLRDGQPLLNLKTGKSPDSNIVECVANQELLQPALARLFAAQLKLPSVPRLRPEVETVYSMCQRTVSESQVDDDAWDIRKMIRFVKRKATRSDPSLETPLQLSSHHLTSGIPLILRFWFTRKFIKNSSSLPRLGLGYRLPRAVLDNQAGASGMGLTKLG